MIRQLNEELRCINKHIKELESKLNTIPPGTLCCARNGNKIKWYFRNESSSYSYLPKKERKLAEQLACDILPPLTLRLEVGASCSTALMG